MSVYALARNMEDEFEMIFGFSLCAIPLQIILVVYFRRELDELGRLELLGNSKVCYH